jgi:hypothetical protein
MIERATRSGEPSGWQWFDTLLGWCSRLAFMLESQHQDAFDAPHLQQIEAEGTRAGGIEPLGCVAVGQAQQLLALAQLGPREGTLQQPFSEVADVGSQLHRLPDHMVRGAHGISGALGWVIVIIGGATTFGLAGMDFDQLAGAIQLDQLGIAARLELGAGWAGRRRY